MQVLITLTSDDTVITGKQIKMYSYGVHISEAKVEQAGKVIELDCGGKVFLPMHQIHTIQYL